MADSLYHVISKGVENNIFRQNRYFRHIHMYKQWVLLNRAPTSIQLHPPPPSSFQPPPSSFQPPPSSLQHPQQYFSQNIRRNWAFSSNLGRKIKSCPF